MRYSFRLAELLGHVPDPRKRPGTIKSIVEYTGLDRHQVAALLKNEVKYIPLKALSRLCDFLIEHGHCSADKLPGALFSIEPENFWELLARRNRLQLSLGVRHEVEQDSPDQCYVVASDSVLLGEILNGVTTLGGTAHFKESGMMNTEGSSNHVPRPEHVKQSLVWSPGQAEPEEVIDRARSVYDDFSESSSDKALVCIGSTKSNPVVELVLASAFGCDPYETQDNVEKASDRKVPFFLRYRDQDPQPASCVGGTQLSQSEKAEFPGIYYEDSSGKWTHVSWDGPGQDAAFVFYIHRESHGRLEMTLGGFSGRGTRLLANTLARRGEDFWPPVYEGQGIQVGAYIIQYTLPANQHEIKDILRTDLTGDMNVIPISGDAIDRRMII
ncbi:MAG: helix-turn-helix transcriptional regulator [Planctomycetota bacterium]|nr:helix-turn-helix transcriptional regulator [Planctomycetota bacterium]